MVRTCWSSRRECSRRLHLQVSICVCYLEVLESLIFNAGIGKDGKACVWFSVIRNDIVFVYIIHAIYLLDFDICAVSDIFF